MAPAPVIPAQAGIQRDESRPYDAAATPCGNGAFYSSSVL